MFIQFQGDNHKIVPNYEHSVCKQEVKSRAKNRLGAQD